MRELLRRVWYLIRQRQFEAELAEEMEFHRAMSNGRGFGNATLAREDSRAVWIWPWLESIWQDGAYAFRNLRQQPGFTAVVLLVLATVIGLHTTLVTVLAGVLLRPGPANEDRLGDPRAVAVLGYDFWQSGFGGDPSIVGGSLRVNDVPFTVVGVVSRDFRNAEPAYGRSVFIPIAAVSLLRANDPSVSGLLYKPDYRSADVVARLAPGATRR